MALTAAVVGVLAGDRLAPLLARTETVLYGAPQAPPVTLTTLGLVGAVAVGVVTPATVRPVLLGAQATTLRTLTPDARVPRGAGRRLPGPSTVFTLTGAAVFSYAAIAAVPAIILARRPLARQLAYE